MKNLLSKFLIGCLVLLFSFAEQAQPPNQYDDGGKSKLDKIENPKAAATQGVFGQVSTKYCSSGTGNACTETTWYNLPTKIFSANSAKGRTETGVNNKPTTGFY